MKKLHNHETDLGYEEFDCADIRAKIESFGKTAQCIAEAIGENLVAPIPANLVPMAFDSNSHGTVLVAILPGKSRHAMNGTGDPFAEVLEAFKKALKDYGPIEDIGV